MRLEDVEKKKRVSFSFSFLFLSFLFFTSFLFDVSCDNDKDSLEWEPGAALPMERVETLKIANAIGVKTWVSLEPVLYPEQTLNLIDMTHKFVDEFKVGKLNYHPKAAAIDWRQFGMNVIAKLESLGKKYYIKDDLKKFLN